MSLTFTILGCGSSGGVPRPALGWGDCNPKNPKNRRRRTSLLAERSGPGGVTRILVDTSPDLREQLIDAGVDWVDAVLYTHAHADHTHGVDDLRALFIHKRRRLEAYMDEATSADMRGRFDYCFRTPAGSEYPPIMNEHRIAAGQPFRIDGEGGPLPVLPLLQAHGDIPSLGFRFGDFAYSCDLSGLPAASEAALAGLDVWVLDALRYRAHPSHLNLEQALDLVARVRPRRAVLTNLHADLDYDVLRGQIPPHVEPAYDGMQITVST